jgi:hypothetical protein
MVDKQFYFVLSILQSKFHCIHLTIKEWTNKVIEELWFEK